MGPPRFARKSAGASSAAAARGPQAGVRRYHLTIVLLLVALLGGVAALGDHPVAGARPRPPGRPRGRARGGGPDGRGGNRGRPRPLDRDHAQPDRQDRRRRSPRSASRARTRSSSSSPASRPGARGGADRQDGPAPVLRPRGRPAAAVDHAGGLPGSEPDSLPAAQGSERVAEKGTPSAWYLFAAPAEAAEGEEAPEPELLAGPELTKEEILVQLSERQRRPEGSEFLAVPGNRIVITCGP